jgi:hypothetical protein
VRNFDVWIDDWMKAEVRIGGDEVGMKGGCSD